MYLTFNDYTITASIHTLTVKTYISMPEGTQYGSCIESATKDEKSGATFLKINPNKYRGELYTYSEYASVMADILKECGLSPESVTVTRVDVRLDSYEDFFYVKYSKPHRLLLSAMSKAYSIDNRYLSLDLISENLRSISIMNSYFEMEFYDKKTESHGRDMAKARLELRSKRLTENQQCLPSEYAEHWHKRFMRALDCMPAILDRYNSDLARNYLCRPDHAVSYIEFLKRNQDRIFTRRQLIDLLGKMKINNPEQAGHNFLRRHDIELVKEADIKAMVRVIEESIDEFFKN